MVATTAATPIGVRHPKCFSARCDVTIRRLALPVESCVSRGAHLAEDHPLVRSPQDARRNPSPKRGRRARPPGSTRTWAREIPARNTRPTSCPTATIWPTIGLTTWPTIWPTIWSTSTTSPDRRRRPDRRPGADLPDADGRDPAVEPRRGDRGRQADRAVADAGSAAACWPPTTSCRRPSSLLEKIRDGRLRLDRTIEVSVTNVREKRHIMGLLEPNLRTLAPPAAAEPGRLRVAVSKQQPDARAARGLAAAGRPPRQGRPADRGARPADPAPAAAAWTSSSRSPRGWTSSRPNWPSCAAHAGGPAERHGRDPPRAPLPDADHAGEPRHAAPPHRANRRLAGGVRRRQARASRPATSAWSSPSPNATATAA